VPSDPFEGGVAVRTVMSFVTGWLGQLGLTNSSKDWLAGEYETQCLAALELFKVGALTDADIEAVKLNDPDRFAFDYIIADESQDWPAPELELIKALYAPERLCLADGVDQLVRGGAANWEHGVPEPLRVTIPLKRCLRMKANLAVFANTLAERAGVNWKVEPNREAGGGRVIIACGPLEHRREFTTNLLEEASAAGNSAIDSLFCVPPANIIRDSSGMHSCTARTLAKWGYEVWDGAGDAARREFPRSADTVRVVQYASCRGLEGWTVFLEGLDQFWTQRRNEAAKAEITNSPLLSGKDAATAFAWRQCLIPLSRGIDTLMIQLVDPENEASKMLLSAARSHPDFVEIVRL